MSSSDTSVHHDQLGADRSSPEQRALAALTAGRSVAICCGSGGVGKTTTAAALGVAAAEMGRRACVVTIDPARRLADALGTKGVANMPTRIEGPWEGELHAVMLDAKGTFDSLVRSNSAKPEQAERILSNALYRNLVSALSGTQEYMATEKLFELHESGDFDLVVVDTPPTRNALDFLDAPARLSGFLDNRVFRLVISPSRGYLRAVSLATQLLLRTIARIAGSEIVEDAIAFFQAFDGMEAGFRARARSVEQLLDATETAFVLVVTPRQDAIAEARYFAAKLASSNQSVDALVVNRAHPRFGSAETPDVAAMPVEEAGSPPQDGASRPDLGGDLGAGDRAAAWDGLVSNLVSLRAVADREADFLAELVQEAAPAPVVRVPLLEEDVHDLAGLDAVVRHLVGEALPLRGGQDPPRQ